MNRFYFLILLGIYPLWGSSPTADDEHTGHVHDEESEDLIVIHADEKAQRSLDMHFEKVSDVSLQAEKTLYGQMTVPPHAVIAYSLPASGKVVLNVKSAQQVHQGELLYTLTSPDIAEIAGNAAQAKAALSRAESELRTLKNRQAQLEKIGTRNSELNTSIQFKEAELLSLKASANAADNQLQILTDSGTLRNNRLEVYAATDGCVQAVNIIQGAWGEQGTMVLSMIDKGVFEFRSTIYSTDPIRYAKAQLALSDGEHTELLDGTLRIEEQPDPATQSRSLYFAPNKTPNGTFAGQSARLYLYSATPMAEGFIPVPNSAIVKVGINNVVFIKTGHDAFVMKKVETLPTRQGKTPVKGLIPGQTIVTKGGYELKYILPTENSKEKKAAGHFHADGQFHEGEH